MKRLTQKQCAICNFWLSYARREGHWPSITDGMQEFSFASTNSMRQHLDAIVKKGFMDRGPRYHPYRWRVVGYRFKLVRR